MVGAVEPVSLPSSPTSSPASTDIQATGESEIKLEPQQDGRNTRAPLQPTVSSIQRDAQSYGVKYKKPREFTFGAPRQAKDRHKKWLKLLGRVGWVAKGVIYALIGGLACDSAVGSDDSNASPQGAFVLIGTANGGKGALVVLAVAILTYSVWRFWEGAVGQGYDESFSKLKNFFKFRLSPLVSGSVYVAYDVLVIELIPRDDDGQQRFARSDAWPNNWHDSGWGIAGLVLIGLGFIAAVVVQLEQFVTKSFHNTIRDDFPYMPQRYWKAFRIFVLVTGHIGVLGRAGIFLFAAILFFRTIRAKNDYRQSAFGAAFAQLRSSKAGRSALFIMGFFVVVYGLFAVLNAYARIFPTPPPTRVAKTRRHIANGGEAPLPPAFGPGETGFNPLHAATSKGLPGAKSTTFSPMRDAVASASRKYPNGLQGAVVGGRPLESDVELGTMPEVLSPTPRAV